MNRSLSRAPVWILAAGVILACAVRHRGRADDRVASPAPPIAAAPVDPREVGVGRLVPELALRDVRGEPTTLAALRGTAAWLVLALRDPGCPVSALYGPSLAALESEFAGRQVAFAYVGARATAAAAELQADALRLGLRGPIVQDSDHVLATALGARTTTEVFVLDAARTVRYRGAVDDQYGIGARLERPRVRHLARALEALLAGRAPPVPATSAPGCALEVRPAVASGVPGPTYHGRVSRIVRASCEGCHRAGGIGPFDLSSLRAVAGRADMLRFVVGEGLMPPWGAQGGGPWWGDYSLTQADRRALLDWVAAGCPEGDPADAVGPTTWPEGWQIGSPDLVLRIPEEVSVAASGTMPYHYAYVSTGLADDRWVDAIEVRPTAGAVVHHVLVFIEEPRRPGETEREHRRRSQGGVRGYFAGMVPGQRATFYPEGFGKRLPARATLKFQIHYTPNGKATRDRTEIGFRFAAAPPRHQVETRSAAETELSIPPRAAHHEVTARHVFREDGWLLSFCPHAHLRGKAWRYTLVAPGGERKVVLDIPRYDFDWQVRYTLLAPIFAPKGAVLEAVAWYDNSARNPSNPDPEARVEFGEQTTDEMMIGYFEWYRAGE